MKKLISALVMCMFLAVGTFAQQDTMMMKKNRPTPQDNMEAMTEHRAAMKKRHHHKKWRRHHRRTRHHKQSM